MSTASAIQIVLGIIDLALMVSRWFEQQTWIEAGYQRAIADGLRARHEALVRANEAREEARRRNASVPPDGQLPDDGFRRD